MIQILLCMLSHFSCVQFFAILWSVAHQAPLSMGFSRQEYWNGFPHPPPGDLPDPGVEPVSLTLRQTVYQLSYQESYLRRENFCKALKASTSYTFLFCFSANNMFIHHSQNKLSKNFQQLFPPPKSIKNKRQARNPGSKFDSLHSENSINSITGTQTS